MKFHKHILAAVAVAAVSAAGIGAYLLSDDEARQAVAAKAEAITAQLPAPFETEPDLNRPYTAGDDFTKFVLAGTPTGSMDAYRILEQCQRQRLYDPQGTNKELVGSCDGITPAMMARAPNLLAEALVTGDMPEAANEMFWLLYRLPTEKLAEARQDPTLAKGLDVMVDTLRRSAPHDRDAIAALALLYDKGGMVERDPEQALTYVVALQAIRPGHPGFQSSRQSAVQMLEKELSPERARAAKEAGLALARSCNCAA